MRLEVENEGLLREVGRYRRIRLPEGRRELVEDLARSGLKETIELNPVETGRARAGWVASLLRLGGVPSAGWSGGRSEDGALTDGRNAGSLSRLESKDQIEIRAKNEVEYINYLEYGTRKMSPFAMVRRALWKVSQRLRRRN
ncbi:MAG: hypothetical protein KDA65_08925 [Planctomycetaceae bacterium]|nr:hypothetical protein [Planctomycetaceae bacterium]